MYYEYVKFIGKIPNTVQIYHINLVGHFLSKPEVVGDPNILR